MFPILKNSPLFRGLETDTIERLLEQVSYTTAIYRTGDLIAQRDTVYSGLMIILRGNVTGEIEDILGKKRVIDTIAAPQLIAPAFLFGGYNRLPIDVIAGEDGTEILTLHRGGLFEMMQDNTVVLSNFIDIISNRANYFSRKIYALSVLMVTEKVAAMLLADGTDEIPLDLDSMAEKLDVTRNTFEQTLAELSKKGIILLWTENGQKTILVKNRKVLSELAGQ